MKIFHVIFNNTTIHGAKDTSIHVLIPITSADGMTRSRAKTLWARRYVALSKCGDMAAGWQATKPWCHPYRWASPLHQSTLLSSNNCQRTARSARTRSAPTNRFRHRHMPRTRPLSGDFLAEWSQLATATLSAAHTGHKRWKRKWNTTKTRK